MADPPTPQDGRILIVNADDFGHSAGVNAGVIKAHEQGIVTSASLMVRCDAAEAAAAYGRSSSLSLGLHVDLGEWTWGDGDWVERYAVVEFEDADAVEAEVRRQLDSFRELAGRDPSHVDSHQHVHTSEPAASVLVRLAQELRVPLRHSGQVRYCGDLYGQTTTGEPMWEAIGVENLIDILRRLEPGITELACHPGEGGDIDSPYRYEREEELGALCDPRVRATIEAEGILLRSFTDVPPHPPRGVRRGDERRAVTFSRVPARDGFTIWLTGLPRSGKSTIAGLVAGKLRALGVERVELLDGDVVREGLCRGLGFSREDRMENIRRIALVSKLLTRNGVAVIVAAISPYREDRELAREEIQAFVEVWCRASVEACAARDYKGLYEKAMRGEITNLTGVNDPYEEPEDADLVLDTEGEQPEQSAERVMQVLAEKGFVRR